MKSYNTIVVGAGASGLMAAGRAAELGSSVLLLEKNKRPGIKLLMTGGGRCNFANNSDLRELIKSYGTEGPFLFSGFSIFGPSKLIDFFSQAGILYKVEDRGRVFPENNNANSILQALLDYNLKNGVEILTEAPVIKINHKANKITSVVLEDGREFKAKKYIISTGGKSYPGSGSSGDAYKWLKILGHNIIEPKPGLGQIIIKDDILKLEGLSISTGELNLFKDNKLIVKDLGDFIFTARGLSGPAALSLSREITKHKAELLEIRIDFLPQEKDLEKTILNLINDNKNSAIKNVLSKICPKRLVEFILNSADKKANGITKEERKEISDKLSAYRLKVSGVAGFNEAMITVGGVDLKEINPKNMQSKIIDNLYLAGELLNLDGPTGGYNLQVAWTTGYLAANQ